MLNGIKKTYANKKWARLALLPNTHFFLVSTAYTKSLTICPPKQKSEHVENHCESVDPIIQIYAVIYDYDDCSWCFDLSKGRCQLCNVLLHFFCEALERVLGRNKSPSLGMRETICSPRCVTRYICVCLAQYTVYCITSVFFVRRVA